MRKALMKFAPAVPGPAQCGRQASRPSSRRHFTTLVRPGASMGLMWARRWLGRTFRSNLCSNDHVANWMLNGMYVKVPEIVTVYPQNMFPAQLGCRPSWHNCCGILTMLRNDPECPVQWANWGALGAVCMLVAQFRNGLDSSFIHHL